MVLYLFAVSPATLLLLSLQRVPSVLSTIQESSIRLLLLLELSCLSFPSCVDSIGTAPPPHVLLTSVLYTALLPLTGEGPPLPLSCVPLIGNQLHATELSPPLGKTWSLAWWSLVPSACELSPSLHANHHMDVLVTVLCRICHMIVLTTDFSGNCDNDFICAGFNEICHRTVSITDLAEFFWKSHNLPNSSILVLPSYELRFSFALRTQAYDKLKEEFTEIGSRNEPMA